MASSIPNASSTRSSEGLPSVILEVRQGATRSASYPMEGVDFLVGSVLGCDLRVAADAASVLCLLARHPLGVTLRKLAPTQAILVNGQPASTRELRDGDRVQIGSIEIQVRITAPATAN